jgi:DNA-binding HxlR family transcriptional regulator
MVTKDKKSEDLLAKHEALDDNCKEIFFTLLVYGSLRHNKLMSFLKQLDIKISRPTLDTHLKHLLESGLVECKTAFQSSEYKLTSDIYELMRPLNLEEIKQHLEREKEEEKKLPKGLQRLNITREELYATFSDEKINDLVEKDVEYLLVSNLLELKEVVIFDLNHKFDSNEVFWKLIGNPMYRMLEKSIANKCRDCPRYKEKLFNKVQEFETQFNAKFQKTGAPRIKEDSGDEDNL